MSSTHDPDFRLKMEAAGIHVHESFGPYPKPDNLHDIQKDLKRSNLATGTTIEHWARYCTAEEKAGNEAKAKLGMVHYIAPLQTSIPVGETDSEVLFKNLEKMWEGAPSPKPDLWDGLEVRDVDSRIRTMFEKLIVPNTGPKKPCIPNCCLEIKGPGGLTNVVEDQACFDGAAAARGMHALRQYLYGDKAFDNKAYSFAATYEGGKLGILVLYTVHPFRVDGNDKPDYNMSKIETYILTKSLEEYVAGVNALESIRIMARVERKKLVRDVKAAMDE